MTEYWIAPNGKAFPILASTSVAMPAKTKRKAHRMIERPLDGELRAHGVLALTSVPPSVNSMFFNRRGTTGKSPGRGKTLAYRNWRAFADREIRDQPSWHVPGKIKVEIRMQPTPGDCDNRIKAALDLLVGAGRIQDDKNVVKVSAEFDPEIRGTLIKIEAV